MSLEYIMGLVADEKNHLKTIDKIHHEIHKGDSYSAHLSTTGTSTTVYFILQSPNTTTRIHLFPQISADIGGTAAIYRECAVSSSYTQITPFNRDRNSVNTTTLLCGVAPTSSYITALGTVLDREYFGAANARSQFGGSVSARNEWILKQNATYLVSYTSTAAANIYITANWYED